MRPKTFIFVRRKRIAYHFAVVGFIVKFIVKKFIKVKYGPVFLITSVSLLKAEPKC